MEIDNFKIIREHLTFESQFDRYIVHIIKRAKDDKGKIYGSNETNRLLKTFYITSHEYFNKKIPVIKDICISNNARAYILPQVRNNDDCLKELLKVVVNNLDNPTISPAHLVRKAYCGLHKSRNKKWVLDCDDGKMIEYKGDMVQKWTSDMILNCVRELLVEINKNPKEAWIVPSRNGSSIVTSPFDLQNAYKKCSLFYEGVHKIDGKDITGILHKDGMVNLYIPNMQ